MKALFLRSLVLVIIGFSLGFTTIATADAYHCGRHGQCWHSSWHHNAGRCYWVPGHWHYGVYYSPHKVCY